ncbi:MAG: protoporphyrinogen oxidase [Saprospirales bacterium TMED214]|nr:MAG: protoporphyrinogen oxidase [Saprospirales bacterium TMED214]
MEKASKSVDFLVVGAGISGMGATYALHKTEKSFAILEGRNRAGGVLESREKNGYTYDLGANSAASSASYLEFIQELGLEDRFQSILARSLPRSLWQKQGLMRITSPLRSILGARWLSPKAKWTLLTEPFRKSQHDAEESVYTFLSKRIGEEAVVKIVDAVMTGIYAGDIHQLSADVVFKELKKGVIEHGSLFNAMRKKKTNGPRTISGFHGGFSDLSHAFEKKFAENLVLNANVQSIHRKENQWEVTLTNGSIYFSKNLILTPPAHATAALLEPVHSELSAALNTISYAPMGVLHLGIPHGDHPLPNELGFLVPNYVNRSLLGALYISQIFEKRSPENHDVIVVFHRHQGEAEAVYQMVKNDLDKIPFLKKDVTILDNTWWDNAIPQFNLGSKANLQKIKQLTQEMEGLELAGNYLGKVGLADVFESGMQAVKRLS